MYESTLREGKEDECNICPPKRTVYDDVTDMGSDNGSFEKVHS
jgi:hypothetical protein